MRRLILTFLALAAWPTLLHAQEREWQLDATDQDAFLVFGVPQSDDVGISFWCKLGSKKMKVMSPVIGTKLKNGASMPITLTIGGKEFALPGRSASGAKGSQDTVEAETEAGGPLIDALKANDRFAVKVGGHQATFPLLDADIDGLVNLCQNIPEDVQQ